MLPFVHQIKIEAIIMETGDNTCGSVSACAVLASMKLPYDSAKIVKDGRDGNATPDYPLDGSSLLGTALSIAKNSETIVDIHLDKDPTEIEKEMDEYEKPILYELLALENVKFKSPLCLNQILRCIENNVYPIIPFYIDGKDEGAHFSPLKGIHGMNLLRFPVGKTGEPIDIDRETFEKVWWRDKQCILVTKK